MRSGLAIKIEHLSKKYTIRGSGQASYRSLRDAVTNGIQSLFRAQPQPTRETFWALDDINLEIKEGEILGVIGPNGAGKSTLLKILSRITEPTSGKLTIRGRVGSLLEVGTGFHPELTGRENIFLSGAILGMSRQEIRSKLDEIVAFADISNFVDNPVKRYSSGMRVRLGFAVAAHLDPEILLIDEVLAVGDLAFQQKCLGKMGNVAQEGRTVLFVSHNLGMIRKLCDSCINIHGGRLVAKGSAEEVTDDYLKNNSRSPRKTPPKPRGALGPQVALNRVLLNQNRMPFGGMVPVSAHQAHEIIFSLAVEIQMPFRINMTILKDNLRLFTAFDAAAARISTGEAMASFQIPAGLLRPGVYAISFGGLTDSNYGDWFWFDEILVLEVLEEWGDGIEFVNHGAINLSIDAKRIS